MPWSQLASVRGMDWRIASRAVSLFAIGAALSLALNSLQVREWGDAPGWPVVVLTAGAAVVVGLLYPVVIGEESDPPDLSKVTRCVAVFVGICRASARFDFSNYFELAVTLLALSFGIWWLFDGSQSGLVFSFSLTLSTTAFIPLLSHLDLLGPLDHGFVYSRLWCISFAGCITFGAIGRRLVAGD